MNFIFEKNKILRVNIRNILKNINLSQQSSLKSGSNGLILSKGINILFATSKTLVPDHNSETKSILLFKKHSTSFN